MKYRIFIMKGIQFSKAFRSLWMDIFENLKIGMSLKNVNLFLIKGKQSYYMCHFIITKMCYLLYSPTLIMHDFTFFLRSHSRLLL